MKHLILLALAVSLTFAQSYKAFAAEFGYETNYEKALMRAKQEKKQILMIQVSNYCPWCRKLEKKVLATQKINDIVQKHYIPLIVNRQEGGLDKRFDTPIVPVTYIIEYKDDTKFTTVRGYQNQDSFSTIIEKW